MRTKPVSAKGRSAGTGKAGKPAPRLDGKHQPMAGKSPKPDKAPVKVKPSPVKPGTARIAVKPASTSRVTVRKPVPPADVLVLGEHPAAYFTAALIRADKKLRVVHCRIPGESEPERLVIINPAFFTLHALLSPLQRKLDMTPLYGLQFLSDDPSIKSEYRSKSGLAYVASFHAVRDLVAARAQEEGVDLVRPEELQINRLDETGLEVRIDGSDVRPKVLALGGLLSDAQHRLLGLPDSWGADIIHRYSFLRLSGTSWADLGSRPVMPMSLNLKQTLCWGWLLPGPKGMQMAVAQSIESLSRVAPSELLTHWASVLRGNGILSDRALPLDNLQFRDLPLAGALAHEGVANRTLLIGPAGGFYSACTEDIYPNCWSAIFAADAIRKALKERHLQDALQPYRSKWRTTLGEYLRGPQQNFRFLLPFIYRNQVMTTRLTESILLGKSVVR